MHRPKRTLSSKVVYKNPLYQVRQDDLLRADGKSSKYYSIVSDPFIVVCALSEDRKGVTMVKNWRYPVRRYLWEFPMGWREPNETPLMAAKRELAEETGLRAKKWVSLGWFYLAPGISTQKGYLFAAERLERTAKQLQDNEVAEIKEFSLGKIRNLLKKKAVLDAPTRVAAQALLDYLS